MKTVVVTGADRNIGLSLCRELAQKGWKVFAGKFVMALTLLEKLQQEYPDHIEIVPIDCTDTASMEAAAAFVKEKAGTVDMVIHNAAGFGSREDNDIKGEFDFSGFALPVNINALGALRLVKAFLPLMETGMKRLCFVSSEAGVVSVSHRNAISSYGMSKTALNITLRLMFQKLQPQGYTFRLYHPGWVRSPKIDSDDQEVPQLHGGKFDPWETARSAVAQFIAPREWEDRMVLVDNEGAAWPF